MSLWGLFGLAEARSQALEGELARGPLPCHPVDAVEIFHAVMMRAVGWARVRAKDDEVQMWPVCPASQPHLPDGCASPYAFSKSNELGVSRCKMPILRGLAIRVLNRYVIHVRGELLRWPSLGMMVYNLPHDPIRCGIHASVEGD